MFLIGCSAAPGAVSNKYQYSYASADEVALDAVDSAQTSFLVEYSDERYSSERLGFYFKTVTSSILQSQGENTVTGESAFTGSSENYIYLIRKLPSAQGVLYQVHCTPRIMNADSKLNAERNARNLSRFIRHGMLEKKAVVL